MSEKLAFARQCVAVFLAMALLDIVFAPYVAKIASREALEASVWASAIVVCNAFVVVSYVKDRRLILPLALGAFAGTWLSVSYLF